MVNKLSRVKELSEKTLSSLKNFKHKGHKIYKDNKVDEKVENFVKNGLSLKQTISIASILVFAMIIVLIPKNHNTQSPIGTINQIESGLLEANISKVSNLIDINNISNQISDSILPSSKQNPLNKEVIATLKADLEQKIHTDFYSIIMQNGDYTKNLENKNAIISKFLDLIFSNSGAIVNMELTNKLKKSATVKIIIFRPDLKLDIPIELGLSKGPDGTWRIIRIENIKSLINTLNNVEQQRLIDLNNKKDIDLNSFINLKGFKIAQINRKDNILIIRASLKNTSKHNLTNLKGELHMFYNEKPLGSVKISIPEKIRPNSFFEKAWSIKLENENALLRSIAKINPEKLSANIDVKDVHFSKEKPQL